jgi:alpha-tubulin suppressor-like RCC1 family protein
MATLNFPDAPDTGDIYFDSNSGFTYEWNGTVWISRDPSTIPNIKELDNISGSFNGSTATFNLTVSSVAVTPATAQQLIINIGNVMQNPGDDYTVSGSTITFTTAPISGLGFQGTLLGTGVSLGTVVDGTVDPSSLDISDSYNVGGITVTGITTVTDFSFSGITTVANLEPADMDISGIGTVSNIIMTKDAAGLGATMGAAVGVVTYFGDGSNLTGLGLTFFPISYDPGISSTNIPLSSNITLDWNHPVKAGSGTITIRTGSASGTVIDQFVVGTSSSISFVNNQVILNPAVDLGYNTEHFVVYPAGTIKSFSDTYQNDQLIYSFTTKALIKQLWMWGANYGGSLGQNQTIVPGANAVSSPIQIPGTTWVSADNMAETSMAVKTDGTLWSWGYNAHGQGGHNNTIKYSSPTQVGTDTTWGKDFKQISASYGTVFIKTNGTLWAWGNNESGELGLNQNDVKYSSPTQVGTDTTWSDVSGSALQRKVAIKTDGTLWTWGYNYWGTLGLNQPTSTNQSSPTQLGTDTTWSKAMMQNNGTGALGLKTDGTLWAWGRNNYGGLGQNTVASPQANGISSPTQIPGTNWSDISSGCYQNDNNNAALKSDGTLWAWGYNNEGPLGQNSEINLSSPTQIPGTTWDGIAMGNKVRYATKTDGTLWSWGYNNFGTLGQNSRVYLSSPTQVGAATNWIGSTLRGNRNTLTVMREG